MRLRYLPILGVLLLACERAPLQTEPGIPTAHGAGGEFDGHHSHFRYGTMSWAPTGNPGEVRFRLRAGFRRDDPTYRGPFAPFPVTGDFIQDQVGQTLFDFGDGNVSAILVPFIVTAHSVEENWIIVEAVDFSAEPFGPGIPHAYAGSGPFTARLVALINGTLQEACCRLDRPPNQVPGLMNRAFLAHPLRTTVSPTGGNSSPVSAIAPIVVVPEDMAATFFVPATDPDGDQIRWRLAETAEAGGGPHPPGLSIDGATGQVTWDTRGLDQANFWTTTIMVEDLDAGGTVKSTIPVDFFLRIRPPAGNAPTCTVNPAGALAATVGEPLSLTVTASDPDAGATVTLNSAGMPSVPESAPALPVTGASPQTSTITWTPTEATVGTHVAVFTATDENGLQGLCSVTITVAPGSGGGGGPLAVGIDIKPGSDENPVNLRSQGKLPVAVLTTPEFDAATLDPATITLGNDDGNDTPVAAKAQGRKQGTRLMASLEDVDGDGDLDLMLHFETPALVANGDLTAGTTELILNGLTTDDTAVKGLDVVRIVARLADGGGGGDRDHDDRRDHDDGDHDDGPDHDGGRENGDRPDRGKDGGGAPGRDRDRG